MPQLSLTQLGTLSAWLSLAQLGKFKLKLITDKWCCLHLCLYLFWEKSCKINRHCINQFYNVNLLVNYPQFTWLVSTMNKCMMTRTKILKSQNPQPKITNKRWAMTKLVRIVLPQTISNTSQLIWPICQNQPKHLG